MKESKRNKICFFVALGFAALSVLVYVITAATGLIPYDIVSNGSHFGTSIAVQDFFGAFVPDMGLTGMGRTWWGASQSAGGVVGVLLVVFALVFGIIAIVIGVKKKLGFVSPILWMILGGWNAFLASFLINGFLRKCMYRSSSFWLMVVLFLSLIGWAALLYSMVASYVAAKKAEREAQLEAKADVSTGLDEQASRQVILEEIVKHEDATNRQCVHEKQANEMVELALKEHIEEMHPEEEAPVEPKQPIKEAKAVAPVVENAAPKETVEEKKPVEAEEKTPEAKPAENKGKKEDEDKETKSFGKYEVFPEAGFFKYRLKANNGQILLVSNFYTTRDGAVKGIETLRKNVEIGTHKVVTDKKGKGQFRIFTANDARLVVAGEVYPDAAGAQSALDSVLRFYQTDRVVNLDEIPADEVREWRAELAEIKESANGKLELALDDDQKWIARLVASNGEVLFVTTSYASKAGLLEGVDGIKKQADASNVSLVCDKQGMYQFKVFTDRGMVLVMGETYPSKEGALSAANSMRNFLAGNPKVVDTTKPVDEKE